MTRTGWILLLGSVTVLLGGFVVDAAGVFLGAFPRAGGVVASVGAFYGITRAYTVTGFDGGHAGTDFDAIHSRAGRRDGSAKAAIAMAAVGGVCASVGDLVVSLFR
jgi:hypothetical protein